MASRNTYLPYKINIPTRHKARDGRSSGAFIPRESSSPYYPGCRPRKGRGVRGPMSPCPACPPVHMSPCPHAPRVPMSHMSPCPPCPACPPCPRVPVSTCPHVACPHVPMPRVSPCPQGRGVASRCPLARTAFLGPLPMPCPTLGLISLGRGGWATKTDAFGRPLHSDANGTSPSKPNTSAVF